MRACWFLLILLLTMLPARAQLGSELARQHAERAGNRLAALRSLRTEGRTFVGGEVVPFVTLAERPNHLRVESFTPRLRVILCYDGSGAPWISHTATKGGVPQDMAEVDARDFLLNADFDGPLVDYARKGFSVDYAGEDQIDGSKAYKLLLMGRNDEIFFLWVDAVTHEVVKRMVYRNQRGRRVTIETRFMDFRPVEGVLQPYRIETFADGELLYAMIIDRIEANPLIAPGAFARPAP
jgi:hypothetical protein